MSPVIGGHAAAASHAAARTLAFPHQKFGIGPDLVVGQRWRVAIGMGLELVQEDLEMGWASGMRYDVRNSVVWRIVAVAVRRPELEELGMIAGSPEEQSLVAVGSSRLALVVIGLVEGHIGVVVGMACRPGELLR